MSILHKNILSRVKIYKNKKFFLYKLIVDKANTCIYTIIRKRQEDKKMMNFEMEMLAGASLDELLELAGVSKEEFEEA